MRERNTQTKTGGRKETSGLIPGDYALSVGKPPIALPDGWHWNKLIDIARLETGHTPSRRHPEYWDGDVPWIGIKDATANHGGILYSTYQYTNELGINNSSARILPKNTVCLSRTASVGYVVVMGRPMATSQDFVNWVCDPERIEYNYLKYVLVLEKRSFLRFASGTTHQTIYFPEVKAFHVSLPPLSEQKAIAHILGSLDDKIQLNRRMNATLEAMAQALFKSWFVDCDPVIDKALAAGNPIPEPLRKRAEARQALGDKRKPLPADVALHFPDRFVFNEEMGWVPEGWDVMPLNQAININPRVSLKKGAVAKSVDMKALPTSGYSVGVVTEKEYSGGAKYENGDVLLARITPCLENGKTGVVDFLKENEVGFGSTEFIVLRGKGMIKTPFVAALSRDEVFRQHCVTSMVGSSGRQRVQSSAFNSYFLCMPDKDEILSEYHRLCSVKFDVISSHKNEICSLASLRDTLLPKLLSGQLRIPDAEKIMNDA